MTKELREQRANLVHEARSCTDAGVANRIWDEVDRIGERAANLEQRSAFERAFATEPENRGGRLATSEYRQLFGNFIRSEPLGEFHQSAEYRALTAGDSTQGGYLTLPQQLSEQIIAAKNATFIRQVATKFEIGHSASLGVPTIDNDPADADWTGETATIAQDSAMTFGKRELHPHYLTKALLATGKLVRSVLYSDRLIASRLAYKFAVTEEKAFLTGDGVKKPLGVFHDSIAGISTARDVSTGNTATAITMAGLVNAMYSLKTQYHASPSLRWIFHRDGVKMIRLLRAEDGGANTGSYLWQPSTLAGQPDTLLGVPVLSSEYVPNTFTSGLHVGIIGDFSYYWIADALQMSMLRLTERFVLTDQVGFIGRMETDGMPVLAEAFARVRLA